MTNRTTELDFRSVDEPQPGDKWQALFREYWPAYEKWFLRDGDASRPSLKAAVRALRQYMPELHTTFERLVDLAGGGQRAARFLSLFRPPPIVTGCSQAVWTRDEIALVRNYDYAPRRCDGVVLRSQWSEHGSVLALTDCLWGVLDGMNDRGLAVALSFGGRKIVGEGFAITIILRYVLETCSTTQQACAVLRRVPSYMAYNVTLVDASGDWATAFLSPDRPTVITRREVNTNHQGRDEWDSYAKFSQTIEREARLMELLAEPGQSLEALADAFLTPPLYRQGYRRGHGTLYTIVYRPRTLSVELVWPRHRWRLGLTGFKEQAYLARYEPACEVSH